MSAFDRQPFCFISYQGCLLGTGALFRNSIGNYSYVITAAHVICRFFPNNEVEKVGGISEVNFHFSLAQRGAVPLNSLVVPGEAVVAYSLPISSNEKLDFAIVLLRDSRLKKISPIRLGSLTQSVQVGTKFSSFGFTVDPFGNTVAQEYAGEIIGRDEPVPNRSDVWYYRTLTPLPIQRGYSGGAILDKNGRLCALVSHRYDGVMPEPSATKSEFSVREPFEPSSSLAMPLSRIARSSARACLFLKPPLPWHELNRIVRSKRRAVRTSPVRNLLPIRPLDDTEEFGRNVSASIQERYNLAANSLWECVKGASVWLTARPSISPGKTPDSMDGCAIRGDTLLALFGDDENILTRESIRLIADCETNLPLTSWHEFPVSSPHGAVVRLQRGPEGRVVDDERRTVIISGSNPDNLAQKLLAIFVDMLVDVNVFYRNQILRELYGEPSACRFFVEAKKNFLSRNFPPGQLYISSAARTLDNQKLDPIRLWNLWERFVNEELLPGAVDHIPRAVLPEPGFHCADPAAERIVEHVSQRVLTTHPQLNGQIGLSQLVSALRVFCREHENGSEPPPRTAIVVVAEKRPRAKRDREALNQKLKRTKWKVNSIRLIPITALNDYIKWICYVKFIFVDLAPANRE